MSVFNQNRSRVVQTIFVVVFVIIVLQLINLQIISSKYRIAADENANLRKQFILTGESFSTEKT